ncbi:hypothetical protein MML48_10g00000219 [Holotrichia oblita]|uniref:Uncharacterized protein n=1 Tax=Holotrichia oblita TaxID=644536 RepID=A0ACB9SGA1_HOLOL|nr:hypothetical protein MML48_10g00000219 [Holotrichia oblita]
MFPKDVPGEVEINVANEESEEDEEEEEEEEVQRPRKKSKKTTPELPTWITDLPKNNMKITYGYKDRLKNVKSDLIGLNEVEIFEKLFDEEVVNHIVKQKFICPAAE